MLFPSNVTCWISLPAMSWLYSGWIQALLQVLWTWKGMWILISQYNYNYYLLVSASLILSLFFSHFAELMNICSCFHQTAFSSFILPICQFFCHYCSGLMYVNLSYFLHEPFFRRDFSCDVLGARVQVLWKGCSNGSSAQTVLGGDGEGKWLPVNLIPLPMKNIGLLCVHRPN